MAINLASKYEKKVSERYSIGSKTDAYAGKDYEFSGVKTINVYSVDTVATVSYTRSGTNRFGSITELGDTKQELTLTQDKAFTFSIDAGNDSEQFNIKQANACLKREIDEVITPEIDKYRLEKWKAGNGLTTNQVTTSNDGVLDKNTIVEAIFKASAQMSDDKVPLMGRTLFIPELTFVKFKLSDIVMGATTLSEKVIRQGYKGMIDGCLNVVTVPSSIFPSGTNFIIKHKNATVDPMKLKNYRVQKNPIGIDGDVVEGRYIYDAFVLESRAKGVYVSSTTSGA